ncbi:3,4-dihydroxy-2-butanone-4-phosphate synthase [Pseudohalioglobus sediminis]|uniref:3,4-dihydroxy-2-butanone 4-phosphate synthase n=1 Tax=Pseudohalioglobus sediminis TaxID=2606449 RepID=A0A5B0WQI5_9GAMM|nr:3,4-dihydroxy-2-butanone-4-phosphate synthase [Pseudohalioglobus sediminis]KAA1188847.1 3,4-dihydroxy-2-butanone-4-phosphate synthase [Pseudohalioglobus sediminis]
MQVNTVDELISDLRQGRMVVLVDDDTDSNNEGVVMVAAEHCDAKHVNFMARKARGLVCLTLTEERCRQLDLPPMVDDAMGEKANFTLSIEAAEGIDTGISAADRALTVQAAVAPHAVPEDIVQPGHIFPLEVVPGGVLTRAGHTEAASDYARLAGLLPAAVIADILTPDGTLADGPALAEFAASNGLKIGTIADLIHFRMVNERTIRRVREGEINTAYGQFRLTAYRDQTEGNVHLALSRGDITPDQPTLVRVHVQSAMRDMLHCEVEDHPGWSISRCMERLARDERGVIVLLAKDESPERLLGSIDLALGAASSAAVAAPDTYTTVGLGSQILRDLGVGKIHLMGAPIKYNAISGFDLEVLDFVDPEG